MTWNKNPILKYSLAVDYQKHLGISHFYHRKGGTDLFQGTENEYKQLSETQLFICDDLIYPFFWIHVFLTSQATQYSEDDTPRAPSLHWGHLVSN